MSLATESTSDRSNGKAVLRSMVWPHRGRMAALSLVSLASALLEALFIVLLTGIGMALVGGDETVGPALGMTLSIPAAAGVAAGALAVRLILSLWGVGMSASLTAKVTASHRRRLARAYLRTSFAIQHAEPTGRLQELLVSFTQRITNAVIAVTTAITAALSLSAFLATGLVMDPLATLAVVVALGVVGAVLAPIRSAVRKRSKQNARASLGFANSVSELGSLSMEMRTFGAEREFEERIDLWTAEATDSQRRTQQWQGVMPLAYMSLAYASILVGVAAIPLLGPVNIASVGAVMLLMVRSLSYGQQLASVSASIAAYLPFLEQVEETARSYEASPATQGASKPSSVTPIDVRGASFAYTDDREALSGVSFRLNPGEAIGIIGPSGAGKSTLAQLLLGLRSPTSGVIEVSDVPLDRVHREWWTGRVAFVPQDAKLFTGTVAENIRFFRSGISDHDLRRAAQQANILTDIQALSGGFDTHLGERGGQLSGGQRQRLSIARALAGRPELLVLDEPTSALDSQSEALIRSSLIALHGELAVIIIAHRMTTLDICDRIMVIEGGRMTAIDKPDRLVHRSPFYSAALEASGRRSIPETRAQEGR